MTSSPSPSLPAQIAAACDARVDLFARLEKEETTCYRVFHGTVEGRAGLTVDRYGPQLLIQTFREPLTQAEMGGLEEVVRERLPVLQHTIYNHRGAGPDTTRGWFLPTNEALEPTTCLEGGVTFAVRGRHRGQDPLLFLDLRVARRLMRETSAGTSVLNLFSYTCGVGVCASMGGAELVWNVDFAGSALEVGEENLRLNNLPATGTRFLKEDVFPTVRQLAGLSMNARGRRQRRFRRFEKKAFDTVVLDPPRWSKGSFGAVDVARDYPSLFKPAVLATRPGGRVLCTNHVPSVGLEEWRDVLERAAAKAGRVLRKVDVLKPEEDFPSFDGSPPLKIIVAHV